MYLALDLGGSTIDYLLFHEEKTFSPGSLESSLIPQDELSLIFSQANISLSGVKTIILTGGRHRLFPDEFQDIPIVKIDEIKAIGCGCAYLSNMSSALGISMGTGTCMVSIKDGIYEHVGGTGVGGGTFLGLGTLLLQTNDFDTIITLADKGNIKNVDLSVEDIVGGDIGIHPGSLTASNFGNINSPSNEDLALGLCNLIGQVIATTASYAAKSSQQSTLVLSGKLTRITPIMDIIKNCIKTHTFTIIIPENASYVSVFGARTLYLQK